MNERLTIPIFPLAVVLFPGSRLPLHIFEERYKLMIRECIDNRSEFGINLIFEQKIRSIGCTARVVDVTKTYDDGTMDIIVEGVRRYSLEELIEGKAAYWKATISWFDDLDIPVDPELQREAVDLYNNFVATVFRGSVRQFDISMTESVSSFFLVQKSGLELIQRQLLMTMTTENARLEFIIGHLRSVIPILSQRRTFDDFVMNDGYIQAP